MREGNKLTAAFIRSIDRNKPKLYPDGHNLYLQISQYGTLSWLFRFMVNGRARNMGLGPLHTINLAEARQLARAARQQLLAAIDPIDARRAARGREKAAAARAVTFKQVADQLFESSRAGWSEMHASQVFATFNETRHGKKVFPAATQLINDLPVGAIDTPLVLRVLEPNWREKPETMNRVRGRIEAVLDAPKVRGHRSGENPARWRGHLDKLLPARGKIARVKRHAALAYPDAPPFMSELRAKSGLAARALEFLILTAARTGEISGATWAEFDLSARTWTIPGERMKAGKQHRVPLCDRAVEILAGLPREAELVFPSSARVMLGLLRQMRGRLTVHGFRSAFRDWCAECTSFPAEMAEMALAHSVGAAVENA